MHRSIRPARRFISAQPQTANGLLLASVMGVAIAGGTATATAGTTYFWDWQPGDPVTDTYDPRGGEINFVHTSYDLGSNRFTWEANFSEAPDSGFMTEAFTLVVNNGPAPSQEAGHLAVLYFDATQPDPVLTAYGYNGTGPNNSWTDGSEQNGQQAPDRIASSLLDMSWIHELDTTTEMDGSHTFTLDIDATAINNHDPLYGDPGGWEGIGYDENIGVWFHPYADVSTSYEDGYLSEWSFIYPNRGWLDVIDAPTYIPAPGALVMIGMAGVLGQRRRRHT